MMKTLVYHWFGEANDPDQVARNLRCPLIASIATIRAIDQESRIIVLNVTDENLKLKQRWNPCNAILDFKVWGIKAYLEEHYRDKAGYLHLSRLFDLRRYFGTKNQEILYSDADVFWLKPPFPTVSNPHHFCFDGYNTGLFYYNPSSPILSKFFELFEAYTIAALNNEDARQHMKKYVGYDAWYHVWDEMITSFIFNEHKELICQIPKYEHCCARDLKDIDPRTIKAFHCNGLIVKNLCDNNPHARGLMGVLVKELWDAINKVIDPTLIYTEDVLEKHLPLQFSLYDDPDVIITSLADDGHYYLNNF